MAKTKKQERKGEILLMLLGLDTILRTSHFTNWKGTQVRRSLMPTSSDDNIKVLHERKKGNRKQEVQPKDRHLPHGQALQKGEGARNTEDNTKKAEDKTKQGPSLSKAELPKDAKDKASPGLQT
ncbi:hypothetical protein P7K49_011705 [Saguinus oedipus]|uniref:Uncharacterized protein n=1 Tax=Saguinus oedipus TaxID=9490 RepID=A0ABQ9VRF8_SAGOE|nr:hypothetical protein P7K49_011705 [Saguinus oedipus]